MIRAAPPIAIAPVSWPRTSGDDPQISGGEMAIMALAPHERG